MSSNVQVAPFDPCCVSLFVFVDETTKRYNLQSNPFFVCLIFDFYVIVILFFLNQFNLCFGTNVYIKMETQSV